MATLLSQLSDRRPQSQPQTAPRIPRASPNHVKSRPADPIVINSILDSFNTLQSPSIITADDGRAYPARGLARPRTVNETPPSPPKFTASPSSPGFGVEYPAGLRMDDESGLSGAAISPAVRTISREGSGYKVPTSPLSPSSAHGHDRTRSSSGGSYHSFSFARKEKDRSTKNNLSSASWVKQGPPSTRPPPPSQRPPPPSDWPKDDDKSVRRQPSDDSIRPPKSRIEILPTPTVSSKPSVASNMSRAEQIIAQASASRNTGPKRRLYLTDTGSQEEQLADETRATIAEATESEDTTPASLPPQLVDENVDSVIQQILEDHVKIEEEHMTPTDRAPRRNSIVDSIPMRTSSLRQSSSSPAPTKRKGKKTKRRSEIGQMVKMRVGAQRDSFVSSASSKEIPDSSWNDLGEDDETVKRILELREQRKARMLAPPTSSLRGLSPSARSDASSARTFDQRSARSESEQGSPILRPKRGPSNPDLPKKVRPNTMYQIETELNQLSSDRHALDRRKTNDQSDEPPQVPALPTTQPHIPLRTGTSYSNASPQSPTAAWALDYSYSAAVDALQSPRSASIPIVEVRPESSAGLPVTPIRNPIASPLQSPKSKSASTAIRSRSFRWRSSPQHPDLPLDYTSKKGHFRTPSLGLRDTVLEHPRDSVDLAVSEFLQADRLNRKIRHPLSGRMISFSEVGDPTGAVVIICLGMGLTRFVSAFYDELASTLRLRLITIDRPGVGQSEPYPANDKSGPLSWPDDVLAVCQHLGVTKFSMLAHSAGAIYALATAIILPHLIRGKLHLLSPWIPPSQFGVISNPTASVSPGGILPRSQRLLRVLPTPFFKAANSSFMTATSASIGPNGKGKSRTELRRLGPSVPSESRPTSRFGRAVGESSTRDSILLMDQFMPEINPTDTFPVQTPNSSTSKLGHSADPLSSTVAPSDPRFAFASNSLNTAEHIAASRQHEYTALLTQRTWELATRDSNPATDLLTCLERHRDIGFRYTDVHREVIITHGSEDKRVPVANVKWLAEQMNRHSVTFGAGSASAGFSPKATSRAGAGPGAGAGLVAGGCEIRVLDGEGHGLMANPVIMGDLLTEIAGYWSGGGRAGV